MSHLFSVGAGAYFPLHFSMNGVPQCESTVIFVFTILVLVGLAVWSTATVILLEQRLEARYTNRMGATGRPGDAPENVASCFLSWR